MDERVMAVTMDPSRARSDAHKRPVAPRSAPSCSDGCCRELGWGPKKGRCSGIIVKEDSVVDGRLNKTDALTRASNEHKLIVEVRANAKLTK